MIKEKKVAYTKVKKHTILYPENKINAVKLPV